MNKSQQFMAAILIFIFIAFVIYVLVQNFWLKTILFVLDFGALLRVLYSIAIPEERKKMKIIGTTCQADVVPELVVNPDGTVRIDAMHPQKKAKKRKAITVKVDRKKRI